MPVNKGVLNAVPFPPGPPCPRPSPMGITRISLYFWRAERGKRNRFLTLRVFHKWIVVYFWK